MTAFTLQLSIWNVDLAKNRMKMIKLKKIPRRNPISIPIRMESTKVPVAAIASVSIRKKVYYVNLLLYLFSLIYVHMKKHITDYCFLSKVFLWFLGRSWVTQHLSALLITLHVECNKNKALKSLTPAMP